MRYAIELVELRDVQSFAEAGVDSFMSLTITSRVREGLDVEISTSFLVEHPTLEEARSTMAFLTGGGYQTRLSTSYSGNYNANSPATSVDSSSVGLEGAAKSLEA